VLQAGVELADAQARFAEHDQMLALDPPPGGTIGGVVATADSGPLRHRYGAPRDLVIGITLALADGTVAHGGGRVIKNVAGYDLPKLAAGSFGTLGVITEVCVRLHPRPVGTATAVLSSDDPEQLERTALELHAKPIEADALDVRWDGRGGAILARFSGAAGADRAAALGGDTVTDDDELWAAQRAGQRGPVVLRVAGLPADLARVLRTAADHGATAVGRAGVGTTWLRLDDATAETVASVRRALQPHPVVLTDAPAALRGAVDPWDVADGPELELMRRVKERFDPEGRCNPGLFAGGI
jgi:glycolate oxidase FAD binding subunit